MIVGNWDTCFSQVHSGGEATGGLWGLAPTFLHHNSCDLHRTDETIFGEWGYHPFPPSPYLCL